MVLVAIEVSVLCARLTLWALPGTVCRNPQPGGAQAPLWANLAIGIHFVQNSRMYGLLVRRHRRRTWIVGVVGVKVAAATMLTPVSAQAEKQPWSHDGIALDAVFLRAGIGAGMLVDTVRSDNFTNTSLPVPAYYQATLNASGAAAQVELGYHAIPRLAVGLGAYFQQIASVRASDVTLHNSLSQEVLFRYDYRFESSLLTLVAPFVDWYPLASVGLHVEAAAGLGIITSGKGRNVEADKAPVLHKTHGNGPFFMAGLGYEFWIAPKCSIGLLARVLAGWGTAEGWDGLPWSNHIYSPGILATVTVD